MKNLPDRLDGTKALTVAQGWKKAEAEAILSGVFKSSVVGRRLMMFHAWFVNELAADPLLSGGALSAAQRDIVGNGTSSTTSRTDAVLAAYERTCGTPSHSLVTKLQAAVKRICGEVNTWNAYLAELRLPPADKAQIGAMLCQASCLSAAQGYHFQTYANAGAKRRR